MRKKLTAAILTIFLLAACSSESKSGLKLIPDALQAEGITFTEIESDGSAYELQGVKPVEYKLENGEIVAVYTFDSATKREAGYQNYLKHQQILSSHAPIVFETGTFLVLYRNKANSAAQTAKVTETQYGEKIRNAVQRMK